MIVCETPEAILFKALSPLMTLPGFAGLLLLTENLDILENQLPYSDEKAAAIATPLLQMRLGLSEVDRDIEFLSVKLQEYQYDLIGIKSGLMLIRLDDEADLDGIREEILKVVESLTPRINKLSLALIGEIFYTETKPDIDSQTQKDKKKEKITEDQKARCAEYLDTLKAFMLQGVVSKPVCEKLFATGFEAAGSKGQQLTPKQIKEFSIGLAQAITIPKKRKTVACEMLRLAQELNI